MDIINGLPDDLLLKILSFLPTKDAVSTCILSKRWEFLWMWLPKLEYVIEYMTEMLEFFLNRTLPLHRAPIIESFRIHIDLVDRLRKPKDIIKQWVEVAVSRHLRELDVYYNAYSKSKNILPSSLYACKSLVILKIVGGIHLDVPIMACFPSLKTLQLRNLTADGESLQRLLSSSPVLENLWVKNFRRLSHISVIVPTLQSLSLSIEEEADGLEIDTPSLKYFKLEDINKKDYNISITNMPKLEKAYVDVWYHEIKSLIGSITSVKHLTLCCSEAVYNDRFVFKQLKHLKLCYCTNRSADLLARLLKNSPNIQVLDIFHTENHLMNILEYWNEPSYVPECLMSSLQTFSWSRYLGRPPNRDFVACILENASNLKTARISFDESLNVQEKNQMIKELSSCSRASTICQLIFIKLIGRG